MVLRIVIFLFDSAIAIILALITRDAVSFVWGLIAGAALEVILSFVLFKPTPIFSFNLTIVRGIVNRGKWVTAYGIFNYLSQESDDIVVGKLLGASPLGIYQWVINYQFFQ